MKAESVCSSVVTRGIKKRYPLHVNGLMEGGEVAILLDSGANISCVNSKELRESKYIIKPTNALLTTAGKTHLNVLGEAEVEFLIDSKCFVHNVFVVEELNCSLLLGNDFLSQYCTVLDYDKRTVTFSCQGQRTELPMLGNWTRTSARNDESAATRSAPVQIVSVDLFDASQNFTLDASNVTHTLETLFDEPKPQNVTLSPTSNGISQGL